MIYYHTVFCQKGKFRKKMYIFAFLYLFARNLSTEEN